MASLLDSQTRMVAVVTARGPDTHRITATLSPVDGSASRTINIAHLSKQNYQRYADALPQHVPTSERNSSLTMTALPGEILHLGDRFAVTASPDFPEMIGQVFEIVPPFRSRAIGSIFGVAFVEGAR